MLVLNDKGHLSFTIFDPVIATHSNQLIGHRRNKCDTTVMVDVGESIKIPFGELGIRGKEPQVDGLLRQRPVEPCKAFPIAGTDRADVNRTAITQCNISFPVNRWG
jgi:hypothetical protein